VFSRLVEISSRQEVDELDAGDSSPESRGERDDAWVRATSEKAKRETDKLDAEMRNYSINMIKESARQTLLAQARHQRLCGDHPAAQRSFQKLRDFQSNAEHELETYLAAIEVALQDRQYNIVLPTVIKAQHALTRLASSVASAAGATGVLTGDQVRERERRARQVAQVTRETNVKLALAKGVALVATGQWDQGAKELVALQDRLGDWEGSVSGKCVEI
jgi:COP9 signalosome complex subunit 1